MASRLMGIKETASILNISVNTLYSWVSMKKFPYVKVGRLTKFDIIDVENYIKANKVSPRY